MTESIPVNLLQDWINDLQSCLKQESRETKTEVRHWINKGMRHGINQIQHRLSTWRRHQKYVQTLNHLGRKFLMVRRVNLSDGRYRKLEWYEGDLFLTLAWRDGAREERGELALEIEDTRDLSTIYLVYRGGSSFDDLAGLARVGGLQSVKNEENQEEWVEKVWT